jgi:hypothetical protein
MHHRASSAAAAPGGRHIASLFQLLCQLATGVVEHRWKGPQESRCPVGCPPGDDRRYAARSRYCRPSSTQDAPAARVHADQRLGVELVVEHISGHGLLDRVTRDSLLRVQVPLAAIGLRGPAPPLSGASALTAAACHPSGLPGAHTPAPQSAGTTPRFSPIVATLRPLPTSTACGMRSGQIGGPADGRWVAASTLDGCQAPYLKPTVPPTPQWLHHGTGRILDEGQELADGCPTVHPRCGPSPSHRHQLRAAPDLRPPIVCSIVCNMTATQQAPRHPDRTTCTSK